MRLPGAILPLLLAPAAFGAPPPEPPKALVPAGWAVAEASRGDLDGDGKDDWAFTLKKPAGERLAVRLVVAFADGKGWKTVVDSAKAVCAGCGGMKAAPDEPVGEPEIKKGVLLLTYMGGSRYMWTTVMKWRWNKDHFPLIGYTNDDTDTLSPDAPEPTTQMRLDINVAAGKALKTVADKKGKGVERPCTMPMAVLRALRLDTFDFEGFELAECK